MANDFTIAERFLKAHYQDDYLDGDHVRADCEHWERVMGDPDKFPNADLAHIDAFLDAASIWLCGE